MAEANWYARTLIDPDRGTFGNFDRDFFCTPTLSKHAIYLPGEMFWIGSIWRYAIDLPWEIHPRGAWGDPRVVGMDFDRSVARLLDWHRDLKAEDEAWIRNFQKQA